MNSLHLFGNFSELRIDFLSFEYQLVSMMICCCELIINMPLKVQRTHTISKHFDDNITPLIYDVFCKKLPVIIQNCKQNVNYYVINSLIKVIKYMG